MVVAIPEFRVNRATAKNSIGINIGCYSKSVMSVFKVGRKYRKECYGKVQGNMVSVTLPILQTTTLEMKIVKCTK